MKAVAPTHAGRSAPREAIAISEPAARPRRAAPSGSASTGNPGRNLRDRHSRIVLCIFLADWFASSAAVFMGLGLRIVQRGEWESFARSFSTGFAPTELYVFGGGLAYCLLLAFFGSYEPGNLYRMHFLVRNIAKCAVLWPLAILALIGLFGYNDLAPRLGVIYCAVTLAAMVLLSRLCSISLLMQPRVRRATSARLIVAGWNDQAASLRDAMTFDLSQLRQIIGCVPSPGGHLRERPPPEVPVLGSYAELPALVGPNRVDGIILADLSAPVAEIRRLIAFCQREYLGFHLVPDYFPVLGSRLEVRTVSGVPLLGVTKLPLDSTFNRVIKRAFDCVGAVVGLVLSAPIIAVFGTLVYFESPGPVIYQQVRTTRGGRRFKIYKIRSMRLDAESESGAVWCTREDPRRLRIGAFMRKWNIDELPQFWNVLKGDMSLVGPRPERPELIELFKDEVPNYNVRHQTRAGITGWAAVHGLRGDTDLHKRVEYDIHYVEHWSFLLDLYCIVATFLKHKNAH